MGVALASYLAGSIYKINPDLTAAKSFTASQEAERAQLYSPLAAKRSKEKTPAEKLGVASDQIYHPETSSGMRLLSMLASTENLLATSGLILKPTITSSMTADFTETYLVDKAKSNKENKTSQSLLGRSAYYANKTIEAYQRGELTNSLSSDTPVRGGETYTLKELLAAKTKSVITL
jgi:hypothetical protein